MIQMEDVRMDRQWTCKQMEWQGNKHPLVARKGFELFLLRPCKIHSFQTTLNLAFASDKNLFFPKQVYSILH